jgi:3-oxoadipate enol-lactonase
MRAPTSSPPGSRTSPPRVPDGAPAPGRLAVHDTGSGPALLLLHAFPLDASQWDHQVASLSGSHRCLRPDMWGCGGTPPHPEPLSVTLDAYADAVLAELDAREVEKAVVAGSSMGGYAAFALLRRAPQRIRGLVLASTRAGDDTEQQRDDRRVMAERALREGVEFVVEPMVQRLLAAPAREQAHITDPLRGRIRRCTPEGIAACQSAMAARPDSTPLLGSIDVPALVISGDHDAVISAADSDAMAAGIRGARREVLPGIGHLGNLEAPAVFCGLLQDFLDGLAG